MFNGREVVTVFRTAVARLVDLLYPPRCLICDADLPTDHGSPLCDDDERRVVVIDDPICDLCGRKMYAQATGELICGECRVQERHFDRAFSATMYNDVMKPLVHLYKYGMRQHLAKPLARWLIAFMRAHVDAASFDAIVPVPLHWRRYQYRGFNQAIELAQPVAREFDLPIITRVLRRVRHTLPQVDLSPEERVKNIEGAFVVRHPERIAGKRLLLVDDVYTTGATLNECARVLKRAGAAEVVGLTLTRPS
jgi:ComF family protein